MDIRTPRPGGAKRVLADASWVLSFIATWGALVVLWDTWWAFPLLFLFACHLGGLSEFVHQAVHLNLFARSRRWNRALGRIAAAMLSMDYDVYREFHMEHHRRVNTPDDPERPIYADPVILAIGAGWAELAPRGKIARTLRLARYVAAALGSFGGMTRPVRAVRWGIPLALVVSGALMGLPLTMVLLRLVVAWYLPLLFLLGIDMVFAQSEHYGTEEIGSETKAVPLAAQYAVSWNLKMPAFLEYFFLKRNIHAEHHLVPSLHWTEAQDGGKGRQLRFPDYLRMLWRQGPRTIPPSEAVRSA